MTETTTISVLLEPLFRRKPEARGSYVRPTDADLILPPHVTLDALEAQMPQPWQRRRGAGRLIPEADLHRPVAI